ncbi:hypothetical protein FRB90_008820 [Tulasnella sp. 427]|nr:hypothetical protein FRB90_008820 [Tulasnella sp. 427]
MYYTHSRRAASSGVEQRKGIPKGAVIAIVVVVVVVVLLVLIAALLLSRRRRRLAAAKTALGRTGSPMLNAPGPNYLPPMPENPTEEPKTQPGFAPLPPPSAAQTSKLQPPPSPNQQPIGFPVPNVSQAAGYGPSRHSGDSVPTAYPAQPPMREPGWR